MNYFYQEILDQLQKAGGKPGKLPEHYGGNKDPKFHVNNPTAHKIVKEFVKKYPNITLEELVNLLNQLFAGKYDDEKCFGGKLLIRYPRLRRQIAPQLVDQWLNTLSGWSQVDSLCQSTFSAMDLLENWPEWKKWILRFAQDKNINKRRASLVLLTAPVRQSADNQFVNLAFKIIDQLKSENDMLITKAVSWLLREMTKKHKNLVADYLEKNQFSLPKIAVRETKRKLETGRK